MSCYSPLRAWEGPVKEKGKINIVWRRDQSWRGTEVVLPCGKCVGCRESWSRQWALRCVHEAQLHEENSFLTLTYDEEHMPKNGSLDKKHISDFMKRLRKKINLKVKYFYSGEYGPKYDRPHYHLLLFGYDFKDKMFLKENKHGDKLYSSPELEKLWFQGFNVVGNVDFGSAGYVAQYALKKIKSAEDIKNCGDKLPEFVCMSRRPGLGTNWINKFQSDVYPDDFIVEDGYKYKSPRFYDNCLDKVDPELLNEIKERRKKAAMVNRMDNDSFRRPVKELVKTAKLKLNKREMEVA